MIIDLAKLLPISVPISGKMHDFLLRIMDIFVSVDKAPNSINTPLGEMVLDASHKPQRFLGYFYFNLLRYYRQSPLGRYILKSHCAGDTWFIDVGANLGVYSIIAKSHGFKTLLIEPEPKHSKFLVSNLKIFNFVESVAVSDSEGFLPLYMEEGNPGSTSLFKLDSYEKSSFEVPVKKLSSILSIVCQPDLAAIKLIKIDVEGFEAHAVRGLRDFLDHGFRPEIWCEVRGMQSGRNGGSFLEVSNFLMSYGYCRFEVVGSEFIKPTDADCETRGVFDLLFLPDDLAMRRS